MSFLAEHLVIWGALGRGIGVSGWGILTFSPAKKWPAFAWEWRFGVLPSLERKAGDKLSMRLVSGGREGTWGIGQLSTAVSRRAARATDVSRVRLPQAAHGSGRRTAAGRAEPGQ